MFEILAMIFGVIHGALIMFNKRINWIFYCLQNIALIIFSVNVCLWGDVIIDIFYFITGVIGYIKWNNSNKDLKISIYSNNKRIIWSIITIIITIIMYFILKNTNNPLPLLDSATTITGFVATYFMLMRKIEAWILWLINDILYIIQYFMLPNQAWYLILLCLMWTIMAIGSYINWKKIYLSYDK